MKNKTKKIENKMKKLELKRSNNINSFEKKPKNGGTPAIEKKEIISIFVKIFVAPRLEKEYNVFTFVLTS